MHMADIAVIGAGGWGTALAVMADKYGNRVSLWSPFEEEVTAIRRHDEHKKLLPGVAVPPSIRLTTDIACAKKADLVVLAVPSFAVRKTAARLADVIRPGTIIANAGKGLEDTTLKRFSQVIAEAVPAARVAVLSGPSHAEEVARGVPTTVVSASEDAATAEEVQERLMNPSFRIYVNQDVTGVELGGALKNVIALAAGVVDGLDMGDNTKAALMTRGLAEMARLGVALGAHTDTFAGAGRNGGSHRHLRQYAFPQPAGGHPHWTGDPAGGCGAHRRHGGRVPRRPRSLVSRAAGRRGYAHHRTVLPGLL